MLAGLFISLLMWVGSFALFDSNNHIIELKTFKELQSVLRNLDHLVGIFYYNGYDCQRCEHAEREIEKLAEDFYGIVPILQIECERAWEVHNKSIPFRPCNPDFYSDLPLFVFYEPPQTRYNKLTNEQNEINEHLFLGIVEFKPMREFVLSKIPTFRQNLTNEAELERFLDFKLLPNKVILFTDKNDTPVLFKGLTSFYRERIDFGEVKKSWTYPCEKYNITKFPTILILELDNFTEIYKPRVYKGNRTFESLKDELYSLALTRRIVRPGDRLKTVEDEPPKEIPLNAAKFSRVIREQVDFTFVHVYSDEKHSAWESVISSFDHLFKYYKLNVESTEDLTFVRDKLKITSLPAILYYQIGVEKKKFPSAIFYAKESCEQIKTDLSYQIYDRSKTISENTINDEIGKATERQKALIVLSFTEEYAYEPFMFKIVSQFERYEQYLTFVKVKNPSEKYKESFAIEYLPDIMMVIPEAGGNHIKTSHMKSNMTAYTLRNFLFEMTSMVINSRPEKDTRIYELSHQIDFEEKCVEKDFCYFALIDGSKVFDSTVDKKLHKQLEIIMNVASRFQDPPQVGWINTGCYKEFLVRFQISASQVPAFFAYSHKKQQFSLMKEAFDTDEIANFIKRIQSKKVSLRTDIEDDIEFDNRNCKEVILNSKKPESKSYQKKDEL